MTSLTPGRSAPVPVPQLEQVREVLLKLTGRDVELSASHPVGAVGEPAVVAVYVTDAQAIGAVVACDLSLAAHAGGALGLVPLPQVEQPLTAGELTQDLSDNFSEVANVLASVFNENPEAPHLQLHKVYMVDDRLPADVLPALRYVVRRLDVAVEIAGYGGGRLSVVAIA